MSKSYNPAADDLPTRIDELICFALYSASNAMNRTYRPLLSPLGLTYPQYITLTALWEKDGVTVGTLCDRLMTETSTLTPLLKRLEQSGYIERHRSSADERQVFVHLTDAGRKLRKEAPEITRCVVDSTGIAPADLAELVRTIGRLRGNLLDSQ